MMNEDEFTTDTTGTEPPYFIEKVVTFEREFNPKYGIDRVCKCGHPYYRHFDTYDDFSSVGCKYCDCHTFEEAV